MRNKDPEIKAILAVQRAVASLTVDERRRVLEYVLQRNANVATAASWSSPTATLQFPHSSVSYGNSGQA